MSNSIPGKFSFTALLAADKEEELELSGGTPVQSERSLSFGDYYDAAEVNSMDKTEAADEKADEVTSTLIQPSLNIGDVNNLGQGSSSSAAAPAPARSPRTKARRARVIRKRGRKRKVTQEDPASYLALAVRAFRKDDYVWPEGYEPRMKCRK